MALTGNDVGHDADLFRMAYPHWPHAEPERIEPAKEGE